MTKDDILEKLKRIPVRPGAQDIVSAGLVSDIFIKDGSVMFSLTVPAEEAQAMEPLRQLVEKEIKSLPGIEKAMVALTAERKAGDRAQAATPPHPSQPRPQPPKAPAQRGAPPAKLDVKGVKHIVAVSSAKGGVGKSTTAVNLALALKANGLKVGILDADIYGPSIPRLLNIKEKPTTVEGTRILQPIMAYGIAAMSIGLLVEEDAPMIWRGPMVVSALTQMLRDVAWNMEGDLDVLVVDMPPGTGDIQLTMAQQVPLSGSVIVSTPQDLALLDARKGIAMFKKVSIPILGIVENMSYFLCPSCGEKHDIFGHGGARETAEKIGIPFLGEIPLYMDIRERSDSGCPIVATEPDDPHSAIYLQLAKDVAQGLQTSSRPAPKITFE
ncbi:iron-sulfur cluster carrier protein ApbC [Cohaesibacter celericrescens]|uniref:Iron-sulfur cluster carrier protein n=1 Tax=Cohaesibacter celericrescens TaxID=2067669 RepID=A0A2N5XQJ3_9HYPH|nr:iron-sulfur cluster carrier protein ApbC [Cohaesibacter celericrescens]PLW76774.1 iron-sulfur cluster carrier protein ApbC [Cohaesibacter celericrescens]